MRPWWTCLREQPKGYDIPFVDVRGQVNGNLAYFGDHVHMNPEGSERFAALLAGELAPELKARPVAGTEAISRSIE